MNNFYWHENSDTIFYVDSKKRVWYFFEGDLAEYFHEWVWASLQFKDLLKLDTLVKVP